MDYHDELTGRDRELWELAIEEPEDEESGYWRNGEWEDWEE